MSSECKRCKGQFVSRNALFIHLSSCQIQSSNNEVECAHSGSSVSRVSKNTEEMGLIPFSAERDISVICEDEFFRVICKPQGIATMGTKGLGCAL